MTEEGWQQVEFLPLISSQADAEWGRLLAHNEYPTYIPRYMYNLLYQHCVQRCNCTPHLCATQPASTHLLRHAVPCAEQAR